MRVATGPAFLNSVMRDERVWPWVTCDGVESADLAAIWDRSVGIEFDTGGFVFYRLDDGVYEAHTLFLPRSRDVVAKTKEAVRYLFCGTDCMRIVTKVAADNPPAMRLAERAGMRHDYTRPVAHMRRGRLHDVHHYSLAMDDWMRSQPSMEAVLSACEEFGNIDKGQRAEYRWMVMNDGWEIGKCQ